MPQRITDVSSSHFLNCPAHIFPPLVLYISEKLFLRSCNGICDSSATWLETGAQAQYEEAKMGSIGSRHIAGSVWLVQ